MPALLRKGLQEDAAAALAPFARDLPEDHKALEPRLQAFVAAAAYNEELRDVIDRGGVLRGDRDAGAIATILDQPPSDAMPALLALLRSRTDEASFEEWAAAVQSEDAPSARPRPRRVMQHTVAEKQLRDDLANGLRTHIHIERHLPDAVFVNRYFDDEDVEQATEAMILKAKNEMLKELPNAVAAAQAGLDALDSETKELLLSLRRHRRRWRLDVRDWALLGQVLAEPEPRDAVRRVVLSALLRGALLAATPAAAGNVMLTTAIESTARDRLPAADVDALLETWAAMPAAARATAVRRVLRYGALEVPADPEDRYDPEIMREFVSSQLAQILLERMPASWHTWLPRIVDNVDELEEERLEQFADMLMLPHAVHETALAHAVLELVAPEKLSLARTLGYLDAVREVWNRMGRAVDDYDEQLIKNLMPKVLDRLSSDFDSHDASRTEMLGDQVLLNVAMALATLPTARLYQLDAQMREMRRPRIEAMIADASRAVADEYGISLAEVNVQLEQSALRSGDQAASSIRQEALIKKAADVQIAHLESFMPANWMPNHIVSPDEVDLETWAFTFDTLAFRLYEELAGKQLDLEPGDYDRARMIYHLSEELLPAEESQNLTRAAITYLLGHVPPDAANAAVPAPRPFTVEFMERARQVDVPPLQLLEEAATASAASLDADAESPTVAFVPEGATALAEMASHELLHRYAIESVIDWRARHYPEELWPDVGILRDETTGALTLDPRACNVNDLVRDLVLKEASRVAANNERYNLFYGALSRARWAFESMPAALIASIVMWNGPLDEGTLAPLEVAYACCRLGRENEGIVEGAKVLNYDMLVEVAHTIISSRLTEAGEINDIYMDPDERVRLMAATVESKVRDAGGDVDAALARLRETRRGPLFCSFTPTALLQQPTSAQDAVDFYHAQESARRERIDHGHSQGTVALQTEELYQDMPDVEALELPGALTARLMWAGQGLLLPDLVQNIADRPLEEVLEFFEKLRDLPPRANIDRLRDVFGWYDSGFAGGALNYKVEGDYLEAWRTFENRCMTNVIEYYAPASSMAIDADMAWRDNASEDDASLASSSDEAGASAPEGAPDNAAFKRCILRVHRPDVTVRDILESSAGKGRGDLALHRELREPPLPRFINVDGKGTALATGRRKECSAAVRVAMGSGDSTVNGKPIAQYFRSSAHRMAALAPTFAVSAPSAWTVWARLEGGGLSCQAQALQLGLARALVKLAPASRPLLKAQGMLFRDKRRVEPKKPARKKARKKRQWVKR